MFRTHPDRPWGPPSLLYNGYRVTFPGVKWRDVNHQFPSSAEVKESVELYLYSRSGLSKSCSRAKFACTFIKIAGYL
jgi:hypothetical protein